MQITSGEFCCWLATFLDDRRNVSLTAEETETIRHRLSAVFLHEIDPEMGDKAHQALLNKIHSSG